MNRVHVIGASGRSGSALCRALVKDGVKVTPVVRNQAKWTTLNIASPPVVADLRDSLALRGALEDASHIVSCAHARFTSALLAASPVSARLVLLGSTRKFTQWPDAHGSGVIAGEAAFMASGRCGVMLHPTMIYGAQGEDNVQRLAALMRRTRVMPLPMGGRFQVQPVHQSDVTRAIRAALNHEWTLPHSVIVAGPSPISYADFLRAVAAAAGLPQPIIIPFPAKPLIWGARLTRHVTMLPTIEPAEVRRLLEDKVFDITDLQTILDIRPIELARGLEQTFRT